MHFLEVLLYLRFPRGPGTLSGFKRQVTSHTIDVSGCDTYIREAGAATYIVLIAWHSAGLRI